MLQNEKNISQIRNIKYFILNRTERSECELPMSHAE